MVSEKDYQEYCEAKRDVGEIPLCIEDFEEFTKLFERHERESQG